MKMVLKISLLFFSLLFSNAIFAQTEKDGKEKFLQPDGFFVGADVSKFLLKALQPERTEYELSFDFSLNRSFYLVGEVGVTDYKYTGEEYLYDYFSNGYYWRAGFFYNFLKDIERDDIVAVGLLFGHSSFDHSAENLSIIDNRYGHLDIAGIEYPGQNANWLEPYFSIKVEIFANFYLGWSMRGRKYLWGSDFDKLKPKIIPGFGNFNTNSNACVTYNVLYKIPF